MSLGESSVSVVITPKTPADRARLERALRILAAEDPPCHALQEPNTRRTMISAVSLEHLERIVDRLKREFQIEAGLGRPTSTGELEP